MNHSMKSQTQPFGESGFQNSKEDYWVRKVYKLMQDRRQVIKLLKDIRKANEDNY